MRALRGQATGEVDFPPALQWTRRPFYFSVKNLVLWGIGIPFAFSAILGALGMFYKILKRKAYIHLPLLAWTAVYFAWQGFAWVKAMRYLLLIYPLLAILLDQPLITAAENFLEKTGYHRGRSMSQGRCRKAAILARPVMASRCA